MNAGATHLRHVWRGHVQPVLMSLPERAAFVDATTERGARLKIAAAVAGLEGVRPEDVDYRIYNVGAHAGGSRRREQEDPTPS